MTEQQSITLDNNLDFHLNVQADTYNADGLAEMTSGNQDLNTKDKSFKQNQVSETVETQEPN